MKCFIAGGAGFIGSHLADALLDEGHIVVCADSYLIGNPENIGHLSANKCFSFYEKDLADYSAVSEIFDKEEFDYVFHLAANSDIQASAKDPGIEYRNTFLTTYNILDCMRTHGVNRLFFSSTSAIYGERIKGAIGETSGPMEPVSYYGAAKLASEAFIHSFSYMNDFNSLIFRFPNVIGSRLTHGVVYDFIAKLKKDGKSLEILGDGTQTKPYMHVSDLIDGIVRLRDAGKQGVQIYNIGVETKTSVTAIADIVCGEMGLKDVEYRYTGGDRGWKGDVPTFEYDLSKIHATGWKAKYTSDEAVKKTVREVLDCVR